MTHTAQIADATAHNVGNTFPPYPKLHARCDAPKATQLATSAETLVVAANLAPFSPFVP